MQANHRKIVQCIFERQLLNELAAERRSVKVLARFARWYELLGPGGGFLWMWVPAQESFVRWMSRRLLRSLLKALSPEEMAELVRLILADDPGLLSRRMKGESLLHLAVLEGAPVEILRILGTTPNVAEFTVDGETPLHVACMKLLPAPSIEFLVNLCPAALTMKDRRGRLPIHCACSPWNGCNLPCDPTAIEILVDANPLTLKEKDRFGRLPLDFMFLKRPKPGPAILKAIVKMIDAYPDVVRLASNDHRILPLHSACRWQCSWKLLGGPDALRTIQRMIDAYPGALQMRDGGGETPIIAAIKAGGWPGKRASWHPLSTACLEGVQLLLDADPSMLKVSGRHDRLPLHCAVVSCLPSGAIQRIIDGYPEALLARDEYGETPLHRACSTRNYKMVQMLLDADPSALKVSDSSGALPLHLACQKSKPGRWLRVIERMIDAYPDALRERSLSGRTPSLSGRTPVMTAILWNDHLFPGVPHFLVGMIKRGGSASVRGVWGYRSSTALNHTLQHSPGPTLVSALIEAWPCALCLPLPPLRVDSNHVAVEALVMQESDAVIEALVEVLLHETTVGVVPDPIRASVRQLVATQPGSRRDARAIQDVFGGYSERRFFLSREDLQDMITGIYRMNKAARVAGAPAAVTPAQHIKGLAAAADNPSCLFVYLLNAGCQSLFAGFHGKSPAKAELTLRPPA